MGGVNKVAKKITKPLERATRSVLRGAVKLVGADLTPMKQPAIEEVVRPLPPPSLPTPVGTPTTPTKPVVMPKEAISPKEAVRGEGEGGEGESKRYRKKRGRGTGARGILGDAPTARKTLLGG